MKQAFAATWHAKKTVLFKAKGVVALEFAALQNTTCTNTQTAVSFADLHYVGEE